MWYALRPVKKLLFRRSDAWLDQLEAEDSNPDGWDPMFGSKALLCRLPLYGFDRDRSPLDLEIGGSAEAFGIDTLAEGTLTATISDLGRMTVAAGFAKFSAAAEGDAEFALADSFCTISGADAIYTFERTIQGENFSISHSYFYAYDFDYVDQSDRPFVFSREEELITDERLEVAEGNIALAEFETEVFADDGLVDVLTDVLTVEDALSTSSIEAILAIG